ncbi:MAG: ABC transporter ATP-binding protein [Chloroflexota bacterium]
MLRFRLRRRLPSFTLDVELGAEASRLVLFGPSGSGKSLTLQALAGLLRPDAGCVLLGQRVLFDAAKRVDLPPQDRLVGYVPQTAALFPHLTVAGNVGYGLRRLPPGERKARVADLLELVHLGGFGQRSPEGLSGGEQQRVALARALAVQPALLLLDEPFSALDAPVRAVLRQELLDLQARLGFAWVFVTHDLEEAYLLADEIAVYQGGRVLQSGPRDQVFYRPLTREVAGLMGVQNVMPVTIAPGSSGQGAAVVEEESGLGLAVEASRIAGFGRSWWACVRQEDVRVIRKDRPTGDLVDGTRLTGSIVGEKHLGFSVNLRFAVDAPRDWLPLWVEVAIPAYRSLNLQRDKRWELFVPREAVHLVPR